MAAAEDADVDAVVAVAAPADPYRLTRQTFRLARLPIPAPIAWPLAWLTTRVYLQPRGHTVESVSATAAVRSIERPVMLVHGSDDGVVPVSDLARLADARRCRPPRSGDRDRCSSRAAVTRGCYEFPAYRAAIARFLTESLGGPFTPDEAAAVAAAVPAVRLPDPERLTTLDEEPGGFRSLTRVLRRRESAPGHGHEPAAGDAGDAGEAAPHSGGSPSSSMIATAAVSSSMSSPSSAASAESDGAVVGRSGAGAPSAR